MDDDKYVVLNKKATWSGNNIGAKDRGAKFELVSATELNGANKANYLSWFEFNYYTGNTKSEIKTVDVYAAEDAEDAFYAVKGCGATEHGLVKSVGNDLEAQWAVTYDETAEKYTLKNRENPTITFDVDKGLLREDDNTKDDIYVVDGELYKIETITPDASSDYYRYLGDVVNQRFLMAHYSAIYDGKAWFATDDEGFVIINTDEQVE